MSDCSTRDDGCHRVLTHRRALALLQIRDEIVAQMWDGKIEHLDDAFHHVVGMLDQQICEIEDGLVGDGKDVVRRMLWGI